MKKTVSKMFTTALARKRTPKLGDEIFVTYLRKTWGWSSFTENRHGTIYIADHDGFILLTERSVFVCSKAEFPTVVYKINDKTYKAW
jgi:hypothetical protein